MCDPTDQEKNELLTCSVYGGGGHTQLTLAREEGTSDRGGGAAECSVGGRTVYMPKTCLLVFCILPVPIKKKGSVKLG